MYNPNYLGSDQVQYGYQQNQPPQQNQYAQNYQLPPQTTGFYGQIQPQFPAQPQPGLFQGQQTGYAQSLQQPGQLGTQATGYNSGGIGAFSSALALVSQNHELKIPNMRLSFITVADQTKFENLFRTAVPVGENAISGDAASDILLRSGLTSVTLAEIWALSDTNKLGLLLFPEFALALALCNSALKGEAVPHVLPDKWRNEVQSFVDAISFTVPEEPKRVLENTPFSSFAPSNPSDNLLGSSMVPPLTSFTSQATAKFQSSDPLRQQRTGGGSFIPLQPQQTTGLVPVPAPLQSQRTGPLAAQTTGFDFQTPLAQQRTGLMPPTTFTAQMTGGFQPQQPPVTSFQVQPTGGFQPQTTGISMPGLSQTPGLQSYQTSYFTPNPQPLHQQLTGFQMQPQRTGGQYGALQTQPTGEPGQWGFVSMPTGGLPGLNAMQQHFLPLSQLPSNNLQNQMGGALKDNVGCAITKQEKLIYDGIFNAWDTSRKGYIEGDVAISIFGKSGLSRPDLETVWNLCDASNRGKLNKDEFAVAMHLVYLRLNGLELPLRLPPELVPPSTKLLQDSVNSLKNSLKGGAAAKNTSNGVASTASRFKNDDDNISYVSSSRYRSKRASELDSSAPNSSSNDLAVQDLKKLIHEKQILLDAAKLESERDAAQLRQTEEANAREIETLKSKIKDLQTQLVVLGSAGSDREKLELLRTLEGYTKYTVPNLILRIFKVNSEIADVKVKLCEAQLKRQYPSWTPEDTEDSIVGTGPNGEVTDADRRRFKSKQLMKRRMAALTGKVSSGVENSNASNHYKMETQKIKTELENQAQMVQDVLASIQELEEGALVSLQLSVKAETGSRKWDFGEGAFELVRLFITELNAFAEPQCRAQPQSNPQPNLRTQSTVASKTTPVTTPVVAEKPTFATADEKSAYVKATAGKRMRERLAKLKALRARSFSAIAREELAQPVQPAQNQPEPVSAAEPTQPKQSVPVAPVQVEKEEHVLKEERKQRSKREERLETLRLEMERLKAQEDDDGWSDDDLKTVNSRTPTNTYTAPRTETGAPQTVPVRTIAQPAPFEKATSVEKSPVENSPVEKSPVEKSPVETQLAPAEKPETAPSVTPAINSRVNGSTHQNNPFVKLSTQTGDKNTNPFFKPPIPNGSIDSKKLENQRAAQRGMGLSDWSDEEDKSSDDEAPNRARAAKLASLLFGGMPQSISLTPTGNSRASEATSLGNSGVAQPQEKRPVVSTAPVTSIPPVALTSPVSSPPSVPSAVPPVLTGVPPVPTETPPAPTAPPAPIPPPVPTVPPGPPPIPTGISPPPPPPSAGIPAPAAPARTGGMPNLGALLGQIQSGNALKKVDESEKRISDSAVVGKVL
ncbi:hypothetical protein METBISCDRAFT_11417 [Metschnikowia bicuspidata]|uniref:Actin cytoskeleton-regulatory complex protein PAN1 n=1 Tax=Metschnikowia bicuspidata TaxID=27322 RepID=A0A4P9ZJZ5_9ASCO|nr:hypothetical protein METBISCDRAFT_11417 [Metschnikowia bicuspidata]